MLPYKHYAALEIEQVLRKQEDPTAPPHECGAEESTLRRWRSEFPDVLAGLISRLSSLAHITINLVLQVPPLQRLYDTLNFLAPPPPDSSRLAWAFFVSRFHPDHVG